MAMTPSGIVIFAGVDTQDSKARLPIDVNSLGISKEVDAVSLRRHAVALSKTLMCRLFYSIKLYHSLLGG